MVKAPCYKSEGAGSIPTGIIVIPHYVKSLRSRVGHGVDSNSNRNEYQG